MSRVVAIVTPATTGGTVTIQAQAQASYGGLVITNESLSGLRFDFGTLYTPISIGPREKRKISFGQRLTNVDVYTLYQFTIIGGHDPGTCIIEALDARENAELADFWWALNGINVGQVGGFNVAQPS